jgi:hypothetical protein
MISLLSQLSDQTNDLESTVVENLNNMFPIKNDQSSSEVSKYDHNIMTCVCVCAAYVKYVSSVYTNY